jgi:hypothetical protein
MFYTTLPLHKSPRLLIYHHWYIYKRFPCQISGKSRPEYYYLVYCHEFPWQTTILSSISLRNPRLIPHSLTLLHQWLALNLSYLMKILIALHVLAHLISPPFDFTFSQCHSRHRFTIHALDSDIISLYVFTKPVCWLYSSFGLGLCTFFL